MTNTALDFDAHLAPRAWRPTCPVMTNTALDFAAHLAPRRVTGGDGYCDWFCHSLSAKGHVQVPSACMHETLRMAARAHEHGSPAAWMFDLATFSSTWSLMCMCVLCLGTCVRVCTYPATK
jgi:hypothetical protein